jgi:uncharacterized RDD family membrane protein YckC
VLGLDNVPLELPIAGAGSRTLAAFLDYLVITLAMVLWGIALFTLAAWRSEAGWWAFAIFLLGAFLLEFGYFAGVEIWREGQTFGKWALGLRVVNAQGARVGPAAVLVRNAVRTIDLLFGIPLMAADPMARRLGDRLAGTLVVHTTPSSSQETVLQRTPQGWDAQQAALLESFLRRADEMEAWRAEKLAGQLIARIVHDDPGMAAAIDGSLPPVEALRRAVSAPAA